jgi:hypothetical protein
MEGKLLSTYDQYLTLIPQPENISRSLFKLSKFAIIRQNLIFERNVGELVVPVEKVSVLDADPQNLIWLVPAEETYS